MDKCFQQVINSFDIEKKMGSHGDHRRVLLACQDESIGYHSSKNLSKLSK